MSQQPRRWEQICPLIEFVVLLFSLTATKTKCQQTILTPPHQTLLMKSMDKMSVQSTTPSAKMYFILTLMQKVGSEPFRSLNYLNQLSDCVGP